MDIDVGKLTKRITIQQANTSRDDFGGELVTWANVAIVWAYIEYNVNTSKEEQIAERETATTDVRFVIRYRPTINAKMKCVYRGIDYDIVAIVHSTDLFWTTIEAKNRQ